MIANHAIFGVIGYIYNETLVPHLVATLIYFPQIYSYYIKGDRSPLNYPQIYICLM